MNTNSNVYTIVYTTIVVVVAAAILAVAATGLKDKQTANIKAETLTQMMAAAGLGSQAELASAGNDAVLSKYAESIEEAYAIDLAGTKVRDLSIEAKSIELIDNFKPQDKAIKANGNVEIPVYKFKSGKTVIPVYGAGLWGPVWGYVALEEDLKTISGVYFDHSGETPGLGAKIKDDPSFAAQFVGKTIDLDNAEVPFDIIKKGSAPATEHNVDAITGATMTSNGVAGALKVWFGAYNAYLKNAAAADCQKDCEGEECTGECEHHNQ